MNLETYRKEVALLVRLRDDETCQYCLRVWGVRDTYGGDVHHVGGRANEICDRETKEYLICLCRIHHNEYHDENPNLSFLMGVAKSANNNPVMSDYIVEYMRKKIRDGSPRTPLRVDYKHRCQFGGYEIGEYLNYRFCPHCLDWWRVS